MTAHPNVARVDQGYTAFGKGDLDALRDLIAPNCTWHVLGDNMLAGEYRGIDDVLAFFGRLAVETGGTLNIEVRDLMATDDHAVALVHSTASRGDRTLSDDPVHVFRMEDGKVVEFWSYPKDAAATDAFWS